MERQQTGRKIDRRTERQTQTERQYNR